MTTEEENPPCPQCGERDMERWHDPHGSGWSCHNQECQWFGVDGESE
ncbi:hypothetical protein [Streptomyces sp. NRRL S-350]|nr:hypothetical protein [Streptomyces sp. NRRL S-350]